MRACRQQSLTGAGVNLAPAGSLVRQAFAKRQAAPSLRRYSRPRSGVCWWASRLWLVDSPRWLALTRRYFGLKTGHRFVVATSAGLRETRYYSKKLHTGQTLGPADVHLRPAAAPL
jgi:hypothetical protein